MGSYVYDQAKTIADSNKYEVQIIKVVSIFTNDKSYNYKEFKIQVFNIADFPFFILPGLFNAFNTYRVKKFFKQNNLYQNLSVIHAHVCYPAAYLANAVADGKKIKTIAKHHGLDVIKLQNGQFNIIKRIQKIFLLNKSIGVLNKIGLNVSVSNKVQDELHTFNNYKPKNECILYNGVDTTKFYTTNKNRENDIYTIGCIGNFWPIKDHISLLKAIKLLLEDGISIKIRFLGYGRTLEKCQKYVMNNSLYDNVEFIPDLKHEQLNAFYNAIDLFVLPSYYEALGCVYLESWATNTPFIAIKDQGIAELLPQSEIENLLADKQSPTSLKEKILEEYHKKRMLPFDEKYDIKNTIADFLYNSFFQSNA